jgi:hypothetical protein
MYHTMHYAFHCVITAVLSEEEPGGPVGITCDTT